jgi:hypothetical protein
MAYCVFVEEKVEFCFLFYADTLIHCAAVLVRYVHGMFGLHLKVDRL